MSYNTKENMKKEDAFVAKEKLSEVEKFPFHACEERGIRKETLEAYGVRAGLSQVDGKTVEAYYFPSYNKKDKLVGYMKQDLTKSKEEKGHWSAVGTVSISNKLFGQPVAEAVPRKRNNVVVTEGQWDTLSVYQAMVDSVKGTTYSGIEPFVCSIPLGTGNAVEALLHNEDFIKSFISQTVFFDDDYSTPAELKKGILKGHEAREAVANAFVGSKVSLFTIYPQKGYKDASDYVQNGDSALLAKDVSFNKKPFSAEKIIKASDVSVDEIIAPRPEGVYVDCFPELMNKIHGFRTRELVLLTSPSGVGKCHGKGQEVLMYDLSLKKVEDVEVGDKLMGDDGTPRTVLTLHNGFDDIYTVTPNKGLPYTVNSEHLLVTVPNQTVPKQSMTKDSQYLISSKDFVSLPKHYKEHVISGVFATPFKYGQGKNDNAYVLGLWLAEGTAKEPMLTLCKSDIELHTELRKYTELKGYVLVEHNYPEKQGSTTFRLNGGFLDYLRSLNVLGNKHIPQDFFKLDYETRLNLLAGIIDGDGYTSHGCFELILKKNQLAKDVVKLAQSLGLRVTCKDKFSKCQNFEGAIYSRILIWGNTQTVPNRLSRKKITRNPNKNPQRVGLKVEKVGYGEYFGFEVDGNHLYCLPDYQVTHNSTVTSFFANAFVEKGEKVGMIYLEETKVETIQRVIASKLKVNYLKFKNNPLSLATREQIEAAKAEIDSGDKLVLLDHFGSLPISQLMQKIKHMHFVEGCSYILLDHLSVVISGSDIQNERKELDIVMTELAAFCAANDVCIIAVSHINRDAIADQLKPKKGKEDEPFWVRVSKESMRGSSALEALSFIVLALEPEILPSRKRGRARLVVLKNRPWGFLGQCDTFEVDDSTWEVILSETEGENTGY